MKYWIRLQAFLGVLLLMGPAWATEKAHAEGVPLKPLIFAIINLALLLAFLGVMLRKPAKDFFASRAALIKKGLDESRELKTEAQKKYSEYENRLQNLEAETQTLIAKLKEDGNLERSRIVEEAKEQIQSLTETSSRIITQEMRKAKEELKKEAVNLAADLAEKLVRENMTAEDQKRILEQYINKMERLS